MEEEEERERDEGIASALRRLSHRRSRCTCRGQVLRSAVVGGGNSPAPHRRSLDAPDRSPTAILNQGEHLHFVVLRAVRKDCRPAVLHAIVAIGG